MGFTAMQYNLVVSTNETAVHVWRKNGLEIVATLPDAFRHARLGWVDAYVMYKKLVPPPGNEANGDAEDPMTGPAEEPA